MSVVSVEQRGPVTILAVNRPEKLNAINKRGRTRPAISLCRVRSLESTGRNPDGRRRPGLFGRRRFSYPEGKVGITGGMIAGLAGRIPHKIAMELMLLGEPITARRGYEVGLVNRVVPDGTELHEAIAMANRIVDLAPLALATMKRFVTEHILPKGPSEQAARFNAELSAVRNSEDAAEGVRAFKERRRPQYEGH
jgi:enoyl-CoA hydratase/carnithine racemase